LPRRLWQRKRFKLPLEPEANKGKHIVSGIRRILYATDYSKASSRAREKAVELAKDYDAELWVVHVIAPTTAYLSEQEFGGAALYLKLEESAKQQAETSMKRLMAALEKAKIKAKSLLLRGSPHEQIIKAAKNKKADIIVIGTHGRTGLSKLFMGSVAGRIVSTAICPVLTVRQ
jgi:nucleotide-binding universal stress UspA family protein